MIVRVLQAKVRASRVSAFDALFLRQVGLMRAQPGLEYVKLARRIQPDGSEDVVLFEEWRDTASLYAWVGPNLSKARLISGARELMDELSVAHYEALDSGVNGEDALALVGDDAPLNDVLPLATGDGAPPEAAGSRRGRMGRSASAEEPRQPAAARLLR